MSDTCGIRTHAGRPHRLSRPAPCPLGQGIICPGIHDLENRTELLTTQHRLSPLFASVLEIVCFLLKLPTSSLAQIHELHHAHKDSLAERSKAVAQGAIPQGRGFVPHSCHLLIEQKSKRSGSCAETRLSTAPWHNIFRFPLRGNVVATQNRCRNSFFSTRLCELFSECLDIIHDQTAQACWNCSYTFIGSSR